MMFNLYKKHNITLSTGVEQTVYTYSSFDGKHTGSLIKQNRYEAKETLRKLYPGAKFWDDLPKVASPA